MLSSAYCTLQADSLVFAVCGMHNLVAYSLGDIDGADNGVCPAVLGTACQTSNQLRLLDAAADLTHALGDPSSDAGPRPERCAIQLVFVLTLISKAADSVKVPETAANPPQDTPESRHPFGVTPGIIQWAVARQLQFAAALSSGSIKPTRALRKLDEEGTPLARYLKQIAELRCCNGSSNGSPKD